MLRAAQFHDLVHQMVARMVKLPFVPAPGMRLEPGDVRGACRARGRTWESFLSERAA